MYTIKENLRPITKIYDDWLNGFYLSGLLQFKEQSEIGSDYVSKVWISQGHEINAKYDNALESSQNPTYKGFLKDNIARLLLLNGVERLASACAVAPTLDRTGRPNTMSFLFTQIMNDGAFRGTLRGLSLNFLQSSLILWPATFLTNKFNGGIKQFIGTYVALDALLYPLDTVKNIMYANTMDPQNIRSVFQKTSIGSLYGGLLWKALFNIPFAGALYSTASGADNALVFWLATIAAYPLNALKASVQVSGNPLPTFRGALPFLLANYFFAWELNALSSPEKLKQLKAEARKKLTIE